MRTALLALVALARAMSPPPRPRTAATMLRVTTDNDNVNIANRSLEFVNIIREDLRRNNDDYVAGGGGRRAGQASERAGPAGRVTSRARSAALTRLPLNRIPLARDPIERMLPKFPIDTRRNLNDTRNETTPKPNSQNATIFRSYSHPVRYYKKVRVEKIKRLIGKGKKLRELRRLPAGGGTPAPDMGEAANMAKGAIRADVVNDETEQKVLNDPNDANGANTGAGVDEAAQHTVATLAEPASTPEAGRGGRGEARPGQRGRHAALRQHAARGSPSPDQLDMAPARGPQIQLMRYKGRLCQRSVLNIEGPVYDVHGRSVVPPYMPEFGRGRQFPNTRAPDMILPRCCNCCKKSVLGCQ